MFGTIYGSLIEIMGARSLRARVPNNSRIIVDYNFNWVSVLGLFFPISMSALLLVQVIYKTLWLLVNAMPLMLNQRSNEVPWGISCECVTNEHHLDELRAIMNRRIRIDSIDVVQKDVSK